VGAAGSTRPGGAGRGAALRMPPPERQRRSVARCCGCRFEIECSARSYSSSIKELQHRPKSVVRLGTRESKHVGAPRMWEGIKALCSGAAGVVTCQQPNEHGSSRPLRRRPVCTASAGRGVRKVSGRRRLQGSARCLTIPECMVYQGATVRHVNLPRPPRVLSQAVAQPRGCPRKRSGSQERDAPLYSASTRVPPPFRSPGAGPERRARRWWASPRGCRTPARARGTAQRPEAGCEGSNSIRVAYGRPPTRLARPAGCMMRSGDGGAASRGATGA
jgi:hypothetical protein